MGPHHPHPPWDPTTLTLLGPHHPIFGRCHGKATNTALTASAPLDTPIKVETYQLTKKALAAIGKEFKKDAKTVTGYLAELDEAALRCVLSPSRPLALSPSHRIPHRA
jgi:hypothetical protein